MQIRNNEKIKVTLKISMVLLAMFLPMEMIDGFLGNIVSIILTMAIIVLWPFGQVSDNIKQLGFYKPKNTIQMLIKGIIMGLFLSFVFKTFLIPILENLLNAPRDLSSFYQIKGNIKVLAQYVVGSILIAGFFEEMLFRGFLINHFLKIFNSSKLGWLLSIVLSAVIFSFFHLYQGIVGVIISAIAGAIFGYLYKHYDKNLWCLVIIHAVFDISSAVLMYFDYYDDFVALFF